LLFATKIYEVELLLLNDDLPVEGFLKKAISCASLIPGNHERSFDRNRRNVLYHPESFYSSLHGRALGFAVEISLT
jgi:hypothetical protein